MPIKRYSGSGQVNQTAKRWNGSAWVKQLVKRWNGESWVTVSGTLHTWQKWSIKTVTVYQYRLDTLSTTGSLLDKTHPEDPLENFLVSLEFAFDNDTGEITFYGGEDYIQSAGAGYGGGGNELLIYSTEDYDVRFMRLWTTIKSVVVDQTTSVEQKDEQIGTVTSYNPAAYPEDGKQGDYWYVAV